MNWKTLLAVLVIGYGAYHRWEMREVTHGPGIIAAAEPLQKNMDTAASIEIKGFQLTPLAEFSADARVLSTEHYMMGKEADLSPVDLALGWGRMSDEAVLKDISISQSNRFYFWRTDHFTIPREEIETHSANMHMIPADKSIERTLKAVRPGQVVSFSGYLVEAKAANGWHWRSSLTRNDTGNGACELVLVRSLSVH